MINVGDKVVVTDVPDGFSIEGIGVGSVGEVVKRVDGTYVDILFGDGRNFSGLVDEELYFKSKNRAYRYIFLVEKFDDKEEKDGMLEVGDKVVVTEVVYDISEGLRLAK